MSISNLTVTPGDTTLTLAWVNGPSNANAIIIKWMTPNRFGGWQGANAVEVPPTQTAWVIGGLINGQVYNVQVSPVRFLPGASSNGTPQSGAPIPLNPPVITSDAPVPLTPPVITSEKV